MEEVERARERLDNIRTVKPILGGLRTISLGSWQAALKRRSSARNYAEHLKGILPGLMPHIQDERSLLTRLRQRFPLPTGLTGKRLIEPKAAPARSQVKALVIGSERGLCGRFNVAVSERAEQYLTTESAKGTDVELMVLGSRAKRTLRRRGHQPIEAGRLSMTTLPPVSLAFDLARRWLAAYEEEELDAVDVIYNRYRGTGTYKTTVLRLIPPQLPRTLAPTTREGAESQGPSPKTQGRLQPRVSWPPPIVDTDPLSLYATVIEQSVAVQLYTVLLDSSAAEHSTRFQLMEAATQNADRLVEELTLAIRTARRHQITQEMQELAAGAGLIGRD